MENSLVDGGERIKYGENAAIREPAEGKGRPSLISPWALTRLAKHYENGAKKYDDHNWRKGMPYSRYIDSLLRHVIAFLERDESEDHPAAIAWNAFSIMHHQELNESEKWDDRWKAEDNEK